MIQSYPSFTQIDVAMRAPVLVQQFAHLVYIPIAPTLEINYLRLSYLLFEIADKKKIQEKTHQTYRQRKGQWGKKSVSTENNGFPSPSGVQLIVCSVVHAIILCCFRFFRNRANSSRAVACSEVQIAVLSSSSTPI